jgi:hypothetical protein
MSQRIEITPNDMMGPVYETLGEGNPHVDQFTAQPAYEWRSWCRDRARMTPLIRRPLLGYWSRLSAVEQDQFRSTLQFLLNADESVPLRAS